MMSPGLISTGIKGLRRPLHSKIIGSEQLM